MSIEYKETAGKIGFSAPRRLFLFLGFLVLTGFALMSATPALAQMCTLPPSGMVGWWPGDLNAKDITPHDHDGTLKGTDPTFTAGEVRQAFSFDGDGDYVDIPNKADLNIPSGKITIDAWINRAANGQFYPSILGKGNVGNFQESYALFLTPSNTVGFLVNSNGMGSGRGIVFGTTLIPLNTWTFVAGTYDGTTLRVYVNGSLNGAGLLSSTTINSTSNDVLIGKADRSTPNASPYPDSYFNGGIDEVELFNRPLSASELGAIYAAGTAGKCKCREEADAEGDMKDDDGHTSSVAMKAKPDCDDNGETDFKDDSGEEMKGKNKDIKMAGNTAVVTGSGTLLDGTPVDYTAVLVGNQPIIGANLFSITWTTATGALFHRSGAMIDGFITIPLP